MCLCISRHRRGTYYLTSLGNNVRKWRYRVKRVKFVTVRCQHKHCSISKRQRRNEVKYEEITGGNGKKPGAEGEN